MTQLPKETQKNGDTNKSKRTNKHAKHKPRLNHLEGGWFQVLVWTQVSTALGDFVTLRLIRGCALDPLEASVLGSKTYSPYGKVS